MVNENIIKSAKTIISNLEIQLVKQIEATGDNLSFGWEDAKTLASVTPMRKSGNIFEIKVELYKKSRIPLWRPRKLWSKLADVTVKADVVNKDTRQRISDAVLGIGQDNLEQLYKSREPITFSISRGQVEVLLDNEQHSIIPIVYID